jgi:hypothetical protein
LTASTLGSCIGVDRLARGALDRAQHARSRGVTNRIASPLRPARPVRPMRCT